MAATRTIGNRLAPPRFILFFVLLAASTGFGLAVVPSAQAAMIGFDVAAIAFLATCLPLFRREADSMRASARENDANRIVLLILSLVLSMVILITVAGELVGEARPSMLEALLIIATLALAWTFANMVYALHYAHLFYTRGANGSDAAGLDFPGERAEPDYWDFVYFSFTIGVALQTSDVIVSSPAIRRVVTGHSVAAFVYNLGVLALSVSVLGSS